MASKALEKSKNKPNTNLPFLVQLLIYPSILLEPFMSNDVV